MGVGITNAGKNAKFKCDDEVVVPSPGCTISEILTDIVYFNPSDSALKFDDSVKVITRYYNNSLDITTSFIVDGTIDGPFSPASNDRSPTTIDYLVASGGLNICPFGGFAIQQIVYDHTGTDVFPRDLEGGFLYTKISGSPLSGICLWVDEASTVDNFTGIVALIDENLGQTQLIQLTNQDLNSPVYSIIASGGLPGTYMFVLADNGDDSVAIRDQDFNLLCVGNVIRPTGINDRQAKTNFGIVWFGNGDHVSPHIARWYQGNVGGNTTYATVFNGST